MKILVLAILTFSISVFAQMNDSALELPRFPSQVLSTKDIDGLVAKDSPEMWKAYSEEIKAKTIELTQKQLYKEAASWLYVYQAAELFSKEGASLNVDIKKTMLSDIPALCDLFETMKKEDDISGFCKILSQLYTIYPDNFKKYLRSAYAVALVYDVLPPVGWPVCNTPSDPVSLSQAEEVFNIFIGDPKTFVFPMDRLIIGELVWIFGIAGPLDELRSLKNERIEPLAIEKLTTSIKDDRKRIEKKKYLPWDTNEREFTPKNIMKYGGSPFEKVYCAWRVANANGIPCLFFSEKSGSTTYAWLTYMSRPGVWKTDVARAKEAMPLFGRPLDPQTWKISYPFDIEMLSRRSITTENGVLSRYFLKMSRMAYDNVKYADASTYALRAIKENPENWEAYIAFINARARFGAPSSELDAFWRKSYEAFRRYPDMCIKMLNYYRGNLIALRKGKEADRLLIAEMRGVMRLNPGLGIEIYSEQAKDMFDRAEDKTEIFKPYQDILRNAILSQNECFKKIVKPLAKMFYEYEDYRSAQRVATMFGASARDASMKNDAAKLYEEMKEPKSPKGKNTTKESLSEEK